MKKIPLLIFFGLFTSFLAQRASRQNVPYVTLTAQSFGNNPQLINRYNALPRMSQLLFFDRFKKLIKPLSVYIGIVFMLFMFSGISTALIIGIYLMYDDIDLRKVLFYLELVFAFCFLIMYGIYAFSFGISLLRAIIGLFNLCTFGLPLLVDMFILQSLLLNFRMTQIRNLLDKIEVNPLA